VQFLSITWIGWLLGTVAGYWLVPARFRSAFLIGITAAFLAIHAPLSLGILSVFVLLLYLVTRVERPRALWSVTIAAVMLVTLVYFKLRVVFGADNALVDTIIPIGLSYYTFRCLHVLFDHHRGSAAKMSGADLLAYLFFLPTIVVGPIHRSPEFLRDRRHLRWSAATISEGIERIVGGYFKIAVLGNFLVTAKLGALIQSLDPQHSFLLQYLRMLRIALNLYLQFSGFSDVAIGFGLLLGYRVMENFRWPYLSRNIADFWRRWHISLTSWSRDYVYMPLLGVTRKPIVATVASFLMIGLWHELSLRFVCWGLYHAFGVITFQAWQRQKRKRKFPVAKTRATRAIADGVAILLTAHYVWLGFALLSQPDLRSAIALLRDLLMLGR
jgi:alginate O-acetyltransferase complex protein AlgI